MQTKKRKRWGQWIIILCLYANVIVCVVEDILLASLLLGGVRNVTRKDLYSLKKKEVGRSEEDSLLNKKH